MPLTTIPLFGRGYSSKSVTVTAQKLVNLYREPAEDPDKSAMSLFGTPGLTLLTNLGTSPIRGMRSVGPNIFAAAGNKLYRVSDGYILGTLNTSAGLVSMSDNGQQLMLVDGAYGYILNLNDLSVFAQITDVDFVAGNTVTFIAGYFVVDNPNGQFRWSALYDGLTWSALDFATAESNPDALNAVVQSGGELYLLGSKGFEIWAPSTDGSVFRRVVGAGLDWGIAAVGSLDYFDGGIVFLAKNWQGETQLVKVQQYQITPLSGPEEDHEINLRAATISGATGFAYMLDGHSFYQLNFPDKSMLYDGLSKSWSEVSSAGGRHWGNYRTEFQTVPYVSDYRNGNLYQSNKYAFTDAGTTIIRTVTSRHVLQNFERISIPELYVDFETGIGLNSGQGVNPQVMLQISKDNGHTYGNERWTTIGAQGKYLTRAVWRRLGMARDFVMRLAISDPIKVVITAAAIRV